ncbi:MAG: trehalose-phosphatase [Solirubrobacterales bacterium]|nr:trehalose-phosphatase [Solirubrobacterales bacterium]
MSGAATLVEALEPVRSDPAHGAVLLDIDGTLAPIARHADDATVPEATRTLLIEIAKRYALVGCVSGRRAARARAMVAIGTIAYVGSHGAELLAPGATHAELDPEIAAWSERVRAFGRRALTVPRQHLRVRAEDKGAIAAFHWRGAPDERAAEAAAREIAQEAQGEGLATHWGRKVLEVRPPVRLDKGVGIRALLGDSDSDSDDGSSRGGGGGGRGSAVRAALYAGDDTTDLDAFGGLRALVRDGRLRSAICVAVGSEEAPAELVERADLQVEGTDGTRRLLEALL